MNFPSDNGECKCSLSVILTKNKSVGYTVLFVRPLHTGFQERLLEFRKTADFPSVTNIIPVLCENVEIFIHKLYLSLYRPKRALRVPGV